MQLIQMLNLVQVTASISGSVVSLAIFYRYLCISGDAIFIDVKKIAKHCSNNVYNDGNYLLLRGKPPRPSWKCFTNLLGLCFFLVFSVAQDAAVCRGWNNFVKFSRLIVCCSNYTFTSQTAPHLKTSNDSGFISGICCFFVGVWSTTWTSD